MCYQYLKNQERKVVGLNIRVSRGPPSPPLDSPLPTNP